EGPSATYNIPMALRLTGELDREALRLALTDLVMRHESLRTVYPVHENSPHQHVLPGGPVELPLTDTTERDVTRLLHAEASRTFDLSGEPPFAVRLFRLGRQAHVLSLVIHHIASDGWSN
ncbi:condensation domain-containing protein, partial [Streptomyces sp. SID161]